jgi:hypothetical protein
MKSRLSLEPDSQTSKLAEPGKAPLHGPTVHPQPAAVPGVPASQERTDVAGPEGLPVRLGIVPPISEELFGSTSGMSHTTPDLGNGINEREELGDVVPMSSGEPKGQRGPFPLGKQVVFASGLAPIGGIGPCFSPRLRRPEARPSR